jgi:hypothetical protein
MGNSTSYAMPYTTAFHHRAYYWKGNQLIVKIDPAFFFRILQRMSHLTHLELAVYSKADAIVQEVFSSIRTVFAYNAQENEIKRYDHMRAVAY